MTLGGGGGGVVSAGVDEKGFVRRCTCCVSVWCRWREGEMDRCNEEFIRVCGW